MLRNGLLLTESLRLSRHPESKVWLAKLDWLPHPDANSTGALLMDLAATALLFLTLTGAMGAAAQSAAGSPCTATVILYHSYPISALPEVRQKKIRAVLDPKIRAMVEDPSMGFDLATFDWKKISLDAMPIPASGISGDLYVVLWGDETFGVNWPIWIVEVNASGARNLVSPGEKVNSGDALSGSRLQVLSQPSMGYPDLLIVSKGYRTGGGAEAEPVCERMVGSYYKNVSCPARCYGDLNSDQPE
jgi:hypothetical protein